MASEEDTYPTDIQHDTGAGKVTKPLRLWSVQELMPYSRPLLNA